MVPFASPHSGTQRRLGQNVSPMVSTLSSYESIIDIIINGSMIPPTFFCALPKTTNGPRMAQKENRESSRDCFAGIA
jgi:hypothetical protein